MAKALECPNCHTRHRISSSSQASTFKCTKCGQRLKVPAEIRGDGPSSSSSSAPKPPARAVASSGAGGAPAPPRRKARPTLSSGDGPPKREEPLPTVAPAAGAGASVPPPPMAPGQTGALPKQRVATSPAPVPKARRRSGKPPRDSLPLPVRLGAWVLAIPIGLVVVGFPARKLGYLTGQKMLDVIVKHSLDRFVPLLVIVALWALATAVLVEMFIEGGRWMMLRRRSRSDDGGNGFVGDAARGAAGMSVANPPARRRGSVAARRGS